MISAPHTEYDFKKEILGKIEAGEICMRPRRYFILKMAILLSVAFLIFVVSALLISYIIFSLRTRGELFLLGFGFKGFTTFFLLFPWLILLLDVALLALLDSLFKRFSFAYRAPLVYLFLGTGLAAVAIGSIITITPLHDQMMRRAEGGEVPLVGRFYDHLRRSSSDDGLFHGLVVAVATSSFEMLCDDDDSLGTLHVLTSGLDPRSYLSAGDQVFVAGEIASNTIQAYGIKRLLQAK